MSRSLSSLRATISLLYDRRVIHQSHMVNEWAQAKKGDPTGNRTLLHYAHKEAVEQLGELIRHFEKEVEGLR